MENQFSGNGIVPYRWNTISSNNVPWSQGTPPSESKRDSCDRDSGYADGYRDGKNMAYALGAGVMLGIAVARYFDN